MNYYDEIKTILIENEAYKKVKDYYKNKNDLMSYYNVGKLLIEAQGGESRAKYGDNLIKEYSIKLTKELGKGYTFTELSRMRQFFITFQNVATVSQQLTWSHYTELLKFNNIDEINYYIGITKQFNLSVRELRKRIKSNEYERLSDNTKQKLIKKEKVNIEDNILNPIIINTSNKNIDTFNEKVLKELILSDVSSFMKQLGQGYSFIDSEYPISFDGIKNYIDILLFNYIFNCFVVIELKVTELKKEHIGQIQVYMNYINKNIKSIYQNETIGIIICKKDNNFVIEYSSDNRIFKTIYLIKNNN